MKNSILRFPLTKMLSAPLRIVVIGLLGVCCVWGGGGVLGQTGPGGVGAASDRLVLWLRADSSTGCAVNGCEVTTWTDLSLASNDATDPGGGGNNPEWNYSQINFNPTVELDNDSMVLNRNIQDSLSIFIVFKTTENANANNNDWWEHPQIISNQLNSVTNFDDFGLTMDDGYINWNHNNSNAPSITTPTRYNSDVPVLISISRDDVAPGNNTTLEVNGGSALTGHTQTGKLDARGTIMLGASADITSGSSRFEGHYAEVIFYDRQLTTTRTDRIDSYLGLKYGLTLAHDYYHSFGGLPYYAIAGFGNGIVGIGRDDNSGLDQRCSMSLETNADTSVTLFKGTFTTSYPDSNLANSNSFGGNLRFLVMGHDGGATTFSKGFCGVPNSMMTRAYKATNTNMVGPATLKLDNNVFTGLVSGGNYYLILSTDPLFDGNDTLIRLNELGNNEDWYCSVTFPAGNSYWSIKEGPMVTPAGIGKDLQLWVRADTGLAVGATVVWDDLSGFGRTMTYLNGVATNLVPAGLNFNDYLENNPATYDKTFGTSVAMDGRSIVVVGRSSGGGNGDEYAGLDGVGLEFDGTAGVEHQGGGGNSWTNPGGAASGLVQNGTDLGATAPTNEFSIMTGYRDAVVNGEFFLGPYDDGTDLLADYDFVEAIVYSDNKFSGGTLDYIETYLAIKYGITLSHNYFSSDQVTTAYDVSTYGNDVAGLGRDDCSNLDQRQSESINSDAVVQVGLGSIFASNALNTNAIGADRSYLIWGNDDGTSCWSDADLVMSTEPRQHIRIDREWKMTESGPGGFGALVITLDTANANFDIPDLPAGATDYYLYVDDDGDFTSGTTTATQMVWNSTISRFEAPISPGGTTIYFTFGTRFTAPAPLNSYCAGDTAYFVGSHLNTNGRCARLLLGSPTNYTLDSLAAPDFQMHGFATDENNGNCLDTTYWVVPAIPSVVTAGVYTITPEITATSGPCGAFTAGENIRQDSIQLGSPIPTDIQYVGLGPTVDSLHLCLGDVNPEITILQGNPGVFSIGSSSTNVPLGTLLNDTTVMVTSSSIGDHKIIFTPQGAGCASYDSLWVSIDSLKASYVQYNTGSFPNTVVCKGFGNIDTSLVIPRGGTFFAYPPGLSIDPNSGRINSIATADTGNYIVVYSPPGDSCYAQDTLIVRIQGEEQAIFNYPNGGTYCINDTNPFPSVTYLPSGPDSGYVCVSPNFALISIDSVTGEIDLSNSSPGVYDIKYDITETCKIETIVTVTLVAPPSPSFNLQSPVCSSQGSLSPTAVFGSDLNSWTEWTGNVTVNMNNGAINLNSSSVGGPFPITLHVTDTTTGCSDSVTNPLTIIGAPPTNIQYPSLTGTYCQSDSNPAPIFLSGSGGGTFLSTPATPALDPNTGIFDLQQATPGVTYTLFYASPLVACPDTATLPQITVNALPDASFTLATDTACMGIGAVAINPTVPPTGNLGVFNGSNPVLGAIAGSAIDLSALTVPDVTYLVRNEVTTGAGCRDTFVAYLTMVGRDDASFIYDPDTICDNGNDPTPLILGNGGGTFWSDPTTNPATVVDSVTGVIDLQASGNDSSRIVYATNGMCPDTSSFLVQILNGFEAFFTYDKNDVCTTDQFLNVDSVVTTAVGGFSPGPGSAGLVVDPTSGQIDLTQSNISGSQQYTVLHTVGQLGTCIDVHSVTVKITAFDSLLSIAYPQDTFCQSVDSIIPIITSSSGSPQGQFANSPGITFNNDSLGIIAVNRSGTGQFVIQYELDGICAEVATTDLFISPDDDSLFAYGNNGAICYSSSDSSLLPSTVPNSTGIYSATSNQASLNLVFVDSTTGEINVAASQPGVYQVTYNSTGICPSSFTSTVRVNDQPEVGTIMVLPGTAVCDSQDVDFSLAGTPGGTVYYYLNGILQTQSSVWAYNSFQEGDSVAVVVENTFGCADTASVIMTITTKPAVRIRQRPGVLTGADPIEIQVGPNLDNTTINWYVTTGDSISVDSSSGSTAELDINGFETLTNNILLESDYIPDSIIYYFQAESRGCIGDLDSIIIYVNPNQFPIFVPEVFTPDGNGLNDTWKIQWSSDLLPEDYIINVYNPSGGRVYQMVGLIDTWDGETLPDGVYWWVLKNQVTSETILAGGVTIRRR